MRFWPFIYVVIGVLVALSNGYQSLVSVGRVLAFLLAVLLWPLVLYPGVNFNALIGV